MAQSKKKWVAFKSNATVPAEIVGERKDKKMQVGEPVQLPESYANHVVQDGFAAFCEAPQKPVLKKSDDETEAAAKLEAARQRVAQANAHLDEVAGTDKEQAARISLAGAESELAAVESSS